MQTLLKQTYRPKQFVMSVQSADCARKPRCMLRESRRAATIVDKAEQSAIELRRGAVETSRMCLDTRDNEHPVYPPSVHVVSSSKGNASMEMFQLVMVGL